MKKIRVNGHFQTKLGKVGKLGKVVKPDKSPLTALRFSDQASGNKGALA